ncbi:MAG: HAD-IC family P-type ATPase [Lachnospiraceae bacterium]|nr:HAD-IC family P-type ATPase [Lachnospiraceae bacterium]
MAAGWDNEPVDPDTRTIKEIIKKNVFTYFNMIFAVLAVLLLIVGSFRDMTFLVVVICNTVIGIIQEIRSKKVLDELNILNAAQARVIREGEMQEIPVEDLVIDDVIVLSAGAQIPADAVVLEGSVQVNESLLTGESDEITKGEGKELLSGSFVVSGDCRACLTQVGADSYISRLTLQATSQKSGEQSEMIRSLDRLVKIVGIIIIPIGLLLFYQQFFVVGSTFRDSVTNMVAAVIGMIPEGLYLMASMALAVSAMRLGQQQVLLHDMKSIETLARVTVLCVDKTGTITENRMEVKSFLPGRNPGGDTVNASPARIEEVLQSGRAQFEDMAREPEKYAAAPRTGEIIIEDLDDEDSPREIFVSSARRRQEQSQGEGAPAGTAAMAAPGGSIALPEERGASTLPGNMPESGQEQMSAPGEASSSGEEIRALLCDFVQGMTADNSTMKAMKEYFTEGTGRKPSRIVPFSSRVKYSAAVIDGVSYVLGAPEFILGDDYELYQDAMEAHGEAGYRVLAFGRYDGEVTGAQLQKPVHLLGTVLLANRVRAGAKETFAYFAERDVEIKVISGDNPVSVSAIAREAGIVGAEDYVDAATLQTDEQIAEAMKRYTVFGRVTPDQKRRFVRALKAEGETVAMTGDGVNDVLALKDADCSVAMASGSEAASQVAQLVLLDSDFSRMPSVVLEGRRVVNNIQRTASLFLVKNIFSLLLSVFSVILVMDYPLEASQISLLSLFTIGVPAFILSQEPNKEPIRGHFLTNVLLRALPAGLTDFIIVLSLVIFCQEFKVDSDCMSTACTLLVSLVGFMILYRIMKPMTKIHWAILITMIAGMVFCMLRMSWLFGITTITPQVAMLMVVFGIIAEPLMRYLSMFAEWVERKLTGDAAGHRREPRERTEM